MKTIRILALLALVVLVGTAGVMAQENRSRISKVSLPGVNEGELYSRAGLLPGGDGAPVPLPTPTDPGAANASLAKAGPLSMIPMPMESGDGMGGLLTPRGGAISTPRQRADREIRQVIRRLG